MGEKPVQSGAYTGIASRLRSAIRIAYPSVASLRGFGGRLDQ